jgi:hypothetical protein
MWYAGCMRKANVENWHKVKTTHFRFSSCLGALLKSINCLDYCSFGNSGAKLHQMPLTYSTCYNASIYACNNSLNPDLSYIQTTVKNNTQKTYHMWFQKRLYYVHIIISVTAVSNNNYPCFGLIHLRNFNHLNSLQWHMGVCTHTHTHCFKIIWHNFRNQFSVCR